MAAIELVKPRGENPMASNRPSHSIVFPRCWIAQCQQFRIAPERATRQHSLFERHSAIRRHEHGVRSTNPLFNPAGEKEEGPKLISISNGNYAIIVRWILDILYKSMIWNIPQKWTITPKPMNIWMRLTKTGLGKRERKKTCPKTGIPHVLYVLISNDWAKPLPSLSLSF